MEQEKVGGGNVHVTSTVFNSLSLCNSDHSMEYIYSTGQMLIPLRLGIQVCVRRVLTTIAFGDMTPGGTFFPLLTNYD